MCDDNKRALPKRIENPAAANSRGFKPDCRTSII